MKIVVVYQGYSGFTEQYAKWIGQELNSPVLTFKEFNQQKRMTYDLLIYGGRVHVGKVDKMQQFKKMVNKSGREWLVFATGGTSEKDKEAVAAIWEKSLTVTERKEVPHFYLQGGLNFEKMRRLDCWLIKTMAKESMKKKPLATLEKQRVELFQQTHNSASKDKIMPLIHLVREKYVKQATR